MSSFNLSVLTDHITRPFTQADIARYVSPVKEIVRRKRLPLRELESYDNTSMLRVDLEPTAMDVNLEKCLPAFDALKTLYPKMYTQVNGERVSVYIPKAESDRQSLPLKQILSSDDYFEYVNERQRALPFVLGETVENQVVIRDLPDLPHLLIAGASGSGKSTALHGIIASLLYRLPPDELQLVMFDAKMVELAFYERLPHLAYPICTDTDEAPKILESLISELQRRLLLMKRAHVLTMARYNTIPNIQRLPYLVVIIDEFADLILSNKSAEKLIVSLAQKGRAAGIHLILATQRPDATVMTPQIKANIPARIALTVSGHYDSQVIIDETGAELLNKKGDMIYKSDDGATRLQGVYVSEDEIDNIVAALIEKYGTNTFCDEVESTEAEAAAAAAEAGIAPLEYVRRLLDGDQKDGRLVLADEFYHSCTAVIERGKASKTFLKKLWGCGDPKAYRYLDRMQKLGLIGAYNEDDHAYPVLVILDDFTTHFVSVGEANA
jgi:S-DNA-T family DNA segregation ATPase FtsK/SpoIIIE